MAPIFTHARGLLLTLPWALALLIQDFVLSLLLLLRLLNPLLAYKISSRVAWSCWAWIQFIFERLNGAHIAISGDDLPYGESAVVISNHVGWSDFYMIQALAMRSGMLGYCRYFAKAQLKKVPLLGWGLMAMGMPLVTRKWQHDSRELTRVFHGITHSRFPVWLISFSEATRFTAQKYAESKAFCALKGRPQPQHLLYPRTKGFIATVQHIRTAPHVKAVYDVTIAYQKRGEWQDGPAFWDTLSMPRLSEAEGYRFEVHVRRWPMEELPHEDDALAKWIETRWVEKGEWLEAKRKQWGGVGKTV
ncbi:hypothetical protein N0V93_000982 [Gnomoniopsis smithogilvyi]|uniref:Phospholipid/glycerol acyltransferase domain-containing protein n=1 Tax=Gnomoniopsis smithogilvyi TaxID=1191159 RepID=A0A9W8Z373_9PEZI|nr:hypothetical protein N0V93_000982 [Gnomoniopsis smithogilvyi]